MTIKTLPNWSHEELTEFLRQQGACTASRRWLASTDYDLKAAAINCHSADWFNWFMIRLWNKQLIFDNTNRIAARIADDYLGAYDELRESYFSDEIVRDTFHYEADALTARIVIRFRELLLPIIEG